jgi:hypothetical protein
MEQVRSVLPPCANPLERVNIDKKKGKTADLAIDIVVSYNKLSIIHFLQLGIGLLLTKLQPATPSHAVKQARSMLKICSK